MVCDGRSSLVGHIDGLRGSVDHFHRSVGNNPSLGGAHGWDQLTLSLTDSNHPEVDNDLACFDSSGQQIGDESNGGTNDQAVSARLNDSHCGPH